MLKEVQHHDRIEAAPGKRQLTYVAHDVLIVNPEAPALLDRWTMAVDTDQTLGTRQIPHGRPRTAAQIYDSSTISQCASNVAPRELCTEVYAAIDAILDRHHCQGYVGAAWAVSGLRRCSP